MKLVYTYVIKEEGNKVIVNTKSLTDNFTDSAFIVIEDDELRKDVIHHLEFPMEEYEYGLYKRDNVLPIILKDSLEQVKGQAKRLK